MFLRKLCLFTLVLACFFCCQKSFAQYYVNLIDDPHKSYDYRIWERNGRFQHKVNEVGFKLLNANRFPRSVAFDIYDKNNCKNAYARYLDGNITVFSNLFELIDSDDELAAILAHEVAHIHQLSTGNWLWKRTKMKFAPQYYEHDADCRGVDYMVKAGYNPTAMITFLNKLTGEHSAFYRVVLFALGVQYWGDYLLFIPADTHPSSSKRLLKVYNHIKEKYPAYLNKDNNNIYYVNFLMNAEENDHIELLKNKHDISPVDMGENL